jgi:ATP-dependent helicase/nuclease subunit A
MTRAKRALYVVTAPAGDSASRNYRRLLTNTLGDKVDEISVGSLKLTGGWAKGDPNWSMNLPTTTEPIRSALEIARVSAAAARAPRLPARRPSADRRERSNAAGLFALDAGAGAEFGSAVHKLFSEVEWNAAEKLVEWASRESDRVYREVAACLRETELEPLWNKPAQARMELWRERAFEVVLDNVWVTGVFDRVVLSRDATGRPERAVVYDFKTGRFPEEQMVAAVARHEGQLNLYRRVVAVLTGLNLDSVAAELVFTQHRRRVPTPVRVV